MSLLMYLVFLHVLSGNHTAFAELEGITTKVVQSTQTGSLSSATGLNLDVVTVTEPTPPPVDPTGGVRATLETGKSWFSVFCYVADGIVRYKIVPINTF